MQFARPQRPALAALLAGFPRHLANPIVFSLKGSCRGRHGAGTEPALCPPFNGSPGQACPKSLQEPVNYFSRPWHKLLARLFPPFIWDVRLAIPGQLHLNWVRASICFRIPLQVGIRLRQVYEWWHVDGKSERIRRLRAWTTATSARDSAIGRRFPLIRALF